MKSRIMIAVTVVIAIVISAAQAFATDMAIIKQNQTVTVYKVYNPGESNTYVETNVLTNPTVSALRSLGVPIDAWGMCSSDFDGFYSTVLTNELINSENLRNELTNTQDELMAADSARKIYKTLFWILFAIGVIAIIIAVFNSKK